MKNFMHACAPAGLSFGPILIVLGVREDGFSSFAIEVFGGLALGMGLLAIYAKLKELTAVRSSGQDEPAE